MRTWIELQEVRRFVERGARPPPIRLRVSRPLGRLENLVTSRTRLGGDSATLERHLLRNFRKYAARDAPRERQG